MCICWRAWRDRRWCLTEARSFQVVLTRPVDSWAWMRSDLLVRLLPFAVVVTAVQLIGHPGWLGVGFGQAGVQVLFGLAVGSVMFAAALLLQVRLSSTRGSVKVPDGPADAGLQTLYYLVNAPLEEAFFRGLIQGGLSVLLGPTPGLLAGTTSYVLYHRLGGWSWRDTLATALVGLPLGLAFWLLPGAPSLLGVSIAHAGATCGFLGPGPYLLLRRRQIQA